MISQWDDLPWERHEHDERRFERQSCSRARGSAGATLSRYRIAAGDRSMPLHVHVDEEELFYVLAGRGLVWQGDAVHEVGAGDLIVHLADREPHTLLAADDADEPLDVLAYASGSATQLTLLPRANVAWVGARWLPQDAPHPFTAEPPLAAGELPALAPRPPSIVALDDVEPSLQDRGPVHRTRRDLARAAGSRLQRAAARDRDARPALVRAPLPLARTRDLRRARGQRHAAARRRAPPGTARLDRHAPGRNRRGAFLRGG